LWRQSSRPAPWVGLPGAWPGNVRGLKSLVERCVVLMVGQTIQAADIPDAWLSDASPG